ncbi:uncharacterized protein [Arachis hypogaea]|uniref:uncharacterized protein isoform X1 n=1 Tax=Arachis hypogaea TaxID=3818 RepID=UPI003B224899
MEVEDDWDMTVEELDSLERDAFLLLNNSMCTNSNSTIFQNHLLPTLPTKPHFRFPSSKENKIMQKNQKTFATTVLVFFPVPCGSVSGRRTTHSVFVLQSRWTLCLKEKNEPSKELPKFSVKLFLHSVGMLQRNSNMTWFHMLTSSRVLNYISIENFEFSIIRGYVIDLEQVPVYSCFIGYVSWQVIISAFRRIPRASWNAKERSLSLPAISYGCSAFFLVRSREGSRRNLIIKFRQNIFFHVDGPCALVTLVLFNTACGWQFSCLFKYKQASSVVVYGDFFLFFSKYLLSGL